MANKLVIFMVLAAFLAIISMLQIQVLATDEAYHLDANRYGPRSLKPNQCQPECTRRCSQTQYHKPCMFFCQKCCKTCLCVPPGFYGNKGVCPCYNNWKTQQGGPKCP